MFQWLIYNSRVQTLLAHTTETFEYHYHLAQACDRQAVGCFLLLQRCHKLMAVKWYSITNRKKNCLVQWVFFRLRANIKHDCWDIETALLTWHFFFLGCFGRGGGATEGVTALSSSLDAEEMFQSSVRFKQTYDHLLHAQLQSNSMYVAVLALNCLLFSLIVVY